MWFESSDFSDLVCPLLEEEGRVYEERGKGEGEGGERRKGGKRGKKRKGLNEMKGEKEKTAVTRKRRRKTGQ